MPIELVRMLSALHDEAGRACTPRCTATVASKTSRIANSPIISPPSSFAEKSTDRKPRRATRAIATAL
jgi:hypothetical protein